MLDITEFFFNGKRGVVLNAGMDLRSPIMSGRQRIEYRRQFLIVNFDQLQRLLGNLGVNRTYGGHIITDITDFILGQSVLIFGLGYNPVLPVRDFPAAHNTLYTGHLFGFGSVNI